MVRNTTGEGRAALGGVAGFDESPKNSRIDSVVRCHVWQRAGLVELHRNV